MGNRAGSLSFYDKLSRRNREQRTSNFGLVNIPGLVLMKDDSKIFLDGLQNENQVFFSNHGAILAKMVEYAAIFRANRRADQATASGT